MTDERKRSEYKFPFLGSYYRNESSPESDEEPSDFTCESKYELIAYLLFGTHLKFDDIAVKTHLFAKRYSLGTTWLIPLRYFGETTFTDPLEIAKNFIDTLDWYPNRLDFPCDDCLDKAFKFGNSKILQSFLSRVETITVDYEDRQFFRFHQNLWKDFDPPVKDMRPIWLALASLKPCCLKNVTLSAQATYPLDRSSLISDMVEVFSSGGNERNLECFNFGGQELDPVFYYSPVINFTGLKRIEILSSGDSCWCAGSLTQTMHNFIAFLERQSSLECLVVESVQNVSESGEDLVFNYNGFGAFYNFLPHVISRPSFTCLRLKNCKIPVNSIQNMIYTFLSIPTEHNQSLEFVDCDIMEECPETHTKPFHSIKHSRTCVCGEYKSINFCVDSPLLPPQWLFGYPELHLQRLELSYNCGPFDVQILDSCPTPVIQNLHCRLHLEENRDLDKVREIACKFLTLHSLSVLEVIQFDDLILSDLAYAFSQPFHATSLKSLHLENFTGDGTKTREFFNVLFSMPKEQLSSFTLKLINCTKLKQKDIFRAWKANSNGQQLKKFIYAAVKHLWVGRRPEPSLKGPIIRQLSHIAVSVNAKYLLV